MMPEHKVEEKTGMIERAIEFLAPQWAWNRQVARSSIDNIRRYDAASKSPRLSGWFTPSTSPDGDTRASKEILRNRTRDLERNNAWYRRAVDVSVNNVIGSGIRWQILNQNKEKDSHSKRAQKIFNDRFLSTKIDYDGRLDFFSLCRLIYRTRLVSGECLIRKHVSRKNGFQIQVLEPDYLDDTKDGIELSSGGYISQGIEFNASGKRTAYWLHEQHPSDYSRYKKYNSVRVPADQIIHYFKSDRPGQIRGVPKGVQILIRLHDLDLFQDAELKKNQISAMLVAFRTRPSAAGKPTSEGNQSSLGLYPGAIQDLPPGEDIRFSSPPQHQMFPEYVRTILMEIAAVFGLTYEMFTGDLKKTNFSSGRMGWIEAARNFMSEQKDFISGVLNPVFLWAMDVEALVSGLHPEKLTTQWFTPHREMIDPAKEIKAFVEAKNENILPLSYIWQGLGYDQDEVINAIAENNKKMDEAGISRSADDADQKTADNNEDEDEDAEDDDKDE